MTPEDRAWEVVRRAFEEREPRPRTRRVRNRLLLALVVLAMAVAGAVSTPSGQAVFQRVREAVGVRHAATELAALPARGRLLVVGPSGTWVVAADGAKRRLGAWTAAAWSPHGLFVVAADRSRVAALTPEGSVRWTLPRADADGLAWEGSRTDTRIAYLAGGELRVVAGDGTGDRVLDAHPLRVAPAWRPGARHVLAYAQPGGGIVLRAVDTGRIVWERRLPFVPAALAWSSDGRLLVASSAHRLAVLDGRRGTVRSTSAPGGALARATFRPGTHELAVTVREAGRSEVRLVDAVRPGRARLLFGGPGRFGGDAWSPDGRWLLLSWPTADQWLFVTAGPRPRVRAVAGVARQFGGGTVPAGHWCCTP